MSKLRDEFNITGNQSCEVEFYTESQQTYLHIWNFSVKVQNPDLHLDLALLSLHVFVVALFPIPPSSRHMFQGVLLNVHLHFSATERTNAKLCSCIHGMLNVKLTKRIPKLFPLCFNFKLHIPFLTKSRVRNTYWITL